MLLSTGVTVVFADCSDVLLLLLLLVLSPAGNFSELFKSIEEYERTLQV
jgi:hypothetical protein